MSTARLIALSLCASSALIACEGTDNAPTGSESSVERAAQQAVVYGDDDRTDYYAVADPALRTLLDQSIVALVLRNDIDVSAFDDVPAGTAIPLGNTLQDNRGLCDDERFLDDPTMGNCSGTLIDDNLVLTAGHCVENLAECRSHLYVFDYYFEADGDLQEIDPDDVYECESVVVTINAGNLDYAIVELDRPVVGRTPAAVNLDDVALPTDTDLTVIGFGSGIPAKVDEGGFVTDGRPGTLDYFEATLDTFGGNSGSGVFNDARELVGILVRGATDYTFDSDAGCTRVNVLAEDSGTAEDATYVARAIDELCNDVSWPSARLCGGSSTCGDGQVDEGEECDDGNLASGDGCNALCAEEFCGDGLVQAGLGELCDDGNSDSNDGCSATCIVECGDGETTGDEQCDDGNTDSNDGCSASCRLELCPLTDTSLTVGTVTLGNTCEGSDVDDSASCGQDNSGGDDGYLFVAPRAGVYSFDTLSDATAFDTVLYARTGCGEAEIACNDDSDLPGADTESSLTLTLDADEEIVVFVSGFRTSCGAYGLNVDVSSCGDGVTDDSEQCDDGNITNGDGCSESCQTEVTGGCVTEDDALVLNVPVTLDSCTGQNVGALAPCGADTEVSLERSFVFTAPATGEYRFDTIGDGTTFDTVVYAASDCDGSGLGCNDDVADGNTRSQLLLSLGEGESANIFVHGYSGRCGVFELLATTDECGNARLDEGEECDDGNLVPGDGCNELCVEDDPATCGDGVQEPGEACDDGNDVALDGCSPLCEIDGCALTEALDFATGSFTGNTCGVAFEDAPNCGFGENGSAAPIAFTAPADGTYRFSTDADRTDFDTVLTASDACGGEQLACNDDTVARRSELQLELTAGENVFLAVSGYEGECGNFELTVTVVAPECGNGALEAGEECDEGDANSDIEANACRTDCSAPFCGDSVVDDGETCDEGDANSDIDPGACRADCSAPSCGDGVVDPSEACDEGPANADVADACRPGCELPVCGDGIVDTGEMCDAGDANGDAPDGCRVSCMVAFCGDGVVDSGEACDEGVFNSDEVSDACRVGCELPSCGDGVIDGDEQCDDGEENSDEVADACRLDCAEPFCGDGVIDVGEGCDEGDANSDDPASTCSALCVAPSCGDGVINGDEECDEGIENADESDACRTMCALPFCGDGIQDSDEECDDGAANADEADACRLDCRIPVCGDGILDETEECDDGDENADEPGACGFECAFVPVEPDASDDAGADAGSDAEADSGPDAGDAGADAGGDVSPDVAADADAGGQDATEDTGGQDTTEDTGGQDATEDTGGQDTTEDTGGQDTTEDTGGQDTTEDTGGQDATEDTGGQDTTEDTGDADTAAPDVGDDSTSPDVGTSDVGSPRPDGGAENIDEEGSGSDSGCAASGGAVPSIWWALLAFGAFRRRRRRAVAQSRSANSALLRQRRAQRCAGR